MKKVFFYILLLSNFVWAQSHNPYEIYNVPVVVHILHNAPQANISDAQIHSAIEALNADFMASNGDFSLLPDVFFPIAAQGVHIQFCLAKIDPSGNPSNGITRTFTQVSRFGLGAAAIQYQNPTYSNLGGIDPWESNLYLNIWVCDLANDPDFGFIGAGLNAYAAGLMRPNAAIQGGAGVVIDFETFGTQGTAQAPYNKNRVLTHEVGHWLGLRHLWGDNTDNSDCSGDDLINDTPRQQRPTLGNRTTPLSDGCSKEVMYMNFMDYTLDASKYMFTLGQREAMRSYFLPGNVYRAMYTFSQNPVVCGGAIACESDAANSARIEKVDVNADGSFTVFLMGGCSEYLIRYKALNQNDWTFLSTSESFVSASGLEPNLSYEIQVSCFDNSIACSFSSSYLFDSQEVKGDCDAPTNVQYTIDQFGRIHITWDANPNAISYVVEVLYSANNYWNKVYTYDNQLILYSFVNYGPNKTESIKFRVRSVCHNNVLSGPSDEINTYSTCPEANNLEVHIDGSSNQITFNWNNSDIGPFEICLKPLSNPSNPICFTSNTMPATFDGNNLVEGEIYNWDVKTFCTNDFSLSLGGPTLIGPKPLRLMQRPFEFYPNPTAGVLYMRIPDVEEGYISISNTLGQEVLFKEVVKGNLSLDLHSLRDGFYYLSFKSKNSLIVEKILLAK